jgi:hypothetical protein
MPRPVLTKHVRERMEERDIAEEQIYAALAHEIRRTPGQPGTVWIHGLVAGGETLKVCVSVDLGKIVTAAWPGR